MASLATVAGFYGCAGQENGGSDEVKAAAGSSSDTSLNLQLALTDKTGVVSRDNTFAAKEDVYFSLRALATTQPVTAQDYLFEVVDAKGAVVSTDDQSCRTFHVDAKGNIDRVTDAADSSGTACQHAFVSVTINGVATMIIAVAPFGDVQKDAHGAMSYRLLVAPASQCTAGQFPSNALSASFTIKAQTATCGNGLVEAGEQCDDGNTTNGDGCSSTCQTEPGSHCCGNGVVDPGEECDDGNKTNGDGCSSDCKKEAPKAVCGNGIVEAGEECDDGNTKNNDGCNAHCQVEHTCCCGNGVLDPGEQCDDGNINDGDGCSHDCKTEGTGSGSGSGSGH